MTQYFSAGGTGRALGTYIPLPTQNLPDRFVSGQLVDGSSTPPNDLL